MQFLVVQELTPVKIKVDTRGTIEHLNKLGINSKSKSPITPDSYSQNYMH